jgi:hypothetical protein
MSRSITVCNGQCQWYAYDISDEYMLSSAQTQQLLAVAKETVFFFVLPTSVYSKLSMVVANQITT